MTMIPIQLDEIVREVQLQATVLGQDREVEAVLAERRSEIDLVLLDVMLPEVSGYEICQEIRADKDLSDVRILMMTARGSAMERRKGLALGADGFIAKPFELGELRAELRRILDGETT